MVNITFEVIKTAFIDVRPTITNIANTDRATVKISSVYLQSLLPESTVPNNLTKHRLKIATTAGADYTKVDGTLPSAVSTPGGGTITAIYSDATYQYLGNNNVSADDGLKRTTGATPTSYDVQIGTMLRRASSGSISFIFTLQYWDGSAWVDVAQDNATVNTYIVLIGANNRSVAVSYDTSDVVTKNVAYQKVGDDTTFDIAGNTYSKATGTLITLTDDATTVNAAYAAHGDPATDILIVAVEKNGADGTSSTNVDDYSSLTADALTFDINSANAMALSNPVKLPAFPSTDFDRQFNLDWSRVIIYSITYVDKFTDPENFSNVTISPQAGSYIASMSSTPPFSATVGHPSPNWVFTSSIVSGSPNKVNLNFNVPIDATSFEVVNFLLSPAV